MPYFIYTYLRILAAFGIFAVPFIVLQLWSLFRTIALAVNYKHRKAENLLDKKTKAGLILYTILTAMLWLPLILFSAAIALSV